MRDVGGDQLGAVPREPGPARAEGGEARGLELLREVVERPEVLLDLRLGFRG